MVFITCQINGVVYEVSVLTAVSHLVVIIVTAKWKSKNKTTLKVRAVQHPEPEAGINLSLASSRRHDCCVRSAEGLYSRDRAIDKLL